jgi:UDP-GlcNAc3NAcA epimerase
MNEGFRPENSPPYTIDNPKIYLCGDAMFDNSLFFAELAERKSLLLEALSLEQDKFVLVTIHRNQQTILRVFRRYSQRLCSLQETMPYQW